MPLVQLVLVRTDRESTPCGDLRLAHAPHLSSGLAEDASFVEEAARAALRQSLRRDLLLAGVPLEVVGSLPVLEQPLDQHRSDIIQLYRNPDRERPPLAIWLRNAVQMAPFASQPAFLALHTRRFGEPPRLSTVSSRDAGLLGVQHSAGSGAFRRLLLVMGVGAIIAASWWAIASMSSSGPSPQDCQWDQDCAQGQRCVQQRCAQCRIDAHCASTSVCEDGRCVPTEGWRYDE